MGLSMLVEVTGFTFMAFFISRIGATPVAGHQIAVNMVSLMFMLPLAIANAASTLVAQRIGAGDCADARAASAGHGLEIGVARRRRARRRGLLAARAIVGLYTADPVIVAAALPLLAWVALFHVADAAQTVAAFVLRAYRIAPAAASIYVVALWGVGLGGGYVAAFDLGRRQPGHGCTARAASGRWRRSACRRRSPRCCSSHVPLRCAACAAPRARRALAAAAGERRPLGAAR